MLGVEADNSLSHTSWGLGRFWQGDQSKDGVAVASGRDEAWVGSGKDPRGSSFNPWVGRLRLARGHFTPKW